MSIYFWFALVWLLSIALNVLQGYALARARWRFSKLRAAYIAKVYGPGPITAGDWTIEHDDYVPRSDWHPPQMPPAMGFAPFTAFGHRHVEAIVWILLILFCAKLFAPRPRA